MKRITRHASALSPLSPLASALLVTFTSQAYAQGVGTDQQLAPVIVTGARPSLPANLPNTTATKTEEDLREQNLFNPEDALRYIPNTTVRKRYNGDRNGLIGGRSFGTLQPTRALAYVDGYLISNFLGRFDAPRWNMITPESIARIDTLYGPYSALFPGNSIGTTIVVTEHTPRAFEASARASAYHHRFSLYGHTDSYDGNQLTANIGTRLDSGLWLAFSANRQDSTGQPMNYATTVANAAGAYPTVTPAGATAVTGIVYDRDPKGLARAVFGANGGAIDHTIQDIFKLKAGYEITPTLELSGLAALWTNDTKNRNQTFLKDAAGNEVWSGKVTDGVNTFNILPSSFAPSTRDEANQQLGFTLKTKIDKGWNGSVVLSDYRMTTDHTYQANFPDPVAASGGAGTVTKRDGTGWYTAEAQALYKPVAGDFGDGKHALTFGAHRNGYTLKNLVNNMSDWRSTETNLNQAYYGKSTVNALYAQDVWRFADSWMLTSGLRTEEFRTFSGQQIAVNGTKTVDYPERKLSGLSPKLSLAFAASNDWLYKASFGRGTRFPNVEELYNGTVTATSVTLSDPNLKAEESTAFELTASKEFDNQQSLRISVFHDDVKDAIVRQSTTDPAVCKTTATSATSYTCAYNIDRVKTNGIEFAWQANDLFIKGLSSNASLSFNRAIVTENAKDPLSVNKYFLRVPKARGSWQLAYRPDDRWLFSGGYRYSGRQYNDVYNLDINPNVYGGVSELSQLDLRMSYKPIKALELAVGIDNLTNQNAFQAHPLPGRTVLAELRYKM